MARTQETKTRKNPPMKRVNVYIAEPQWLALEEVAGITGIPASEHVRRAVDAYLDVTEETLLENTAEA